MLFPEVTENYPTWFKTVACTYHKQSAVFFLQVLITLYMREIKGAWNLILCSVQSDPEIN